jgi:hypothetical protein
MWTSAFQYLGTRVAAPALAACVLCAPVWGAAADGSQSATEDGQSAVWTQKELTFVYQGFTTRYSCDGLRDKVRVALLELGVRKKDLKVNEYGCSSSFGRPDPFPGVRVKMSVLEPAGGSSDDKQTPVQAHWKPVDLKLDSFSTDSGECELVEQIKSKILPLLAARNVNLTSDCIPHQASATRPSLKLEVLVADQKEDKAASSAKAATASR